MFVTQLFSEAVHLMNRAQRLVYTQISYPCECCSSEQVPRIPDAHHPAVAHSKLQTPLLEEVRVGFQDVDSVCFGRVI